jgi:hypothetical protein
MHARRVRRLVAVFVATATAVATLAVATPAVAATRQPSLEAGPTPVTIKGIDYRLSLTIYNQSVNISLSRVDNPDGSGPLKAIRTVRYGFYDLGSILEARPKLARGRLDTGAKLAPWGRIDARFRSTDPLDRSCNDHNRSREGRLRGTIRLNTDTKKLGTVKVDSMRATMFSSDGLCRRSTPLPCADGVGVGTDPGPKGVGVSWHRAAGSKRAYLYSYSGRNLKTERTATTAIRDLEITAYVPARSMTVGDNLSGSTFTGDDRLDVRNTARFRATTEKMSYNEPCGPATKDRVTHGTYRSGTVKGNLVIQFLLGRPRRLENITFSEASIFRNTTR